MTVLSVVPANRLNMNEIRSEIGSLATNLFDFKWSDHILNDIQWLRADTFSWQSGSVYEAAYQHLVEDFNNIPTSTETLYCFNSRQGTGTRCYTKELFSKQWDEVVLYNSDGSLLTDGSVPPLYWYTETSLVSDKDRYWDRDAANDVVISINTHTETIGSHTVTYYLAEDGHRIVLPDMEETVANIYNESGVAWYYILDVDNQRFKLPRSGHGNIVEKYSNGTEWYRVYSDGWCEQGGTISWSDNPVALQINLLETYTNANYNVLLTTQGTPQDNTTNGVSINTKYTSYFTIATYTNNRIVDWQACGYISSVPENSQYKYLYFYVGNFTQTAVEQTAGLNAELFNSKADKTDLKEIQCIVETYQNGTSWYRVYSDGWCEQGGFATSSNTADVTTYTNTIIFLKPFKDINYTFIATGVSNDDSNYYQDGVHESLTSSRSTARLTVTHETTVTQFNWQACGYIEV